jgi:hypothetical protein
MSKTPAEIAAILERFEQLEERERQREEGERRAREFKLERDGPSPKRVTKTGTGTGQIQCVTEECRELFKKYPVELTFTETTQFMKDASGSVTDNPETSWTHYHLKDNTEANCPVCGDPRNILPPNAQTAWDGTRRKPNSELENLRKLRNAEIQRVEIVGRVEQANLEVQEAVTDDVRLD